MEKDIIFISHSTHQDDYPAGWLASKLVKLGYKVFIDLEDLRAGDTFYTVIQPVIQKQTYKFITINTASYISKATDPNSGVRKEINTAATITDDKNFIIPVRFDGIDFTSFPMDYVMRNGIDFHNRWGEGLNELVQELEKLGSPKTNKETNPLQLWHKAIRNRNKTLDASEKIHSNWFEIILPESIYIHKPDNVDKETLWKLPFSVVLERNQIICFTSPETISSFIPIISSKEFTANDFLVNEEIYVDENFTLIKPYDKLKQLLNRSFKNHCGRVGLKKYKQASEKEIFFFRFKKDTNKPISISLKKYNLTRTQLNGNKWGTNWHFAIDAKTEFKPFPHYRVFYHVIFTDEKYLPFTDTDLQQKMRKRFSSVLNNKKTFELILASMLSLTYNKDGGYIEIKINNDKYMRVSNYPLSFQSNQSYLEPNSPIQNDSI